MTTEYVLFQKTPETEQLDCAYEQALPDIIRQLYQIEIKQPIAQVKQSALETIARCFFVQTLIWHSQQEQVLFDIESFFTKRNLRLKETETFEIKLDDSNIHHRFFVIFEPQLTPLQIQTQAQQFQMLLPLLAEIYRQTIIHSFYLHWKEWPFIQKKQVFGQTSKQDNPTLRHLYPGQVVFQEKQIQNGREIKLVLIRYERIENQLFLDQFIQPKPIETLTDKQKQICFYLKACYTNAQIAEKLGISIKTVNNHLTAIYQQLGINRAQLFKILNTTD